ncbi:MAG: alanine racemase [candidate division KSB1 bacterium]|nr:alanine racemase [candidate division KSB1 bacterium]MDQ7062889.1 alanine racemase [candidate division KSB1 bacterium]
MLDLNQIIRPTAIIDQRRVLNNIARMSEKAHKSGVRFRPHFKTHQSAVIGNWFRNFGTRCITVSSLDMAMYFAEHGWDDITVAFPVNLREIDKIRDLASRIRLNLLALSPEAVTFLQNELQSPVGLWIKIDSGYRRTGMPWKDTESIVLLAKQIQRQSKTEFCGILTHSGNSYSASSLAEIRTIYAETVHRMQTVRKALTEAGITQCEISIGDTPCCSVVDTFTGVDEVRPGNFVFYDAMQWRLGSCSEADIAMVVACPVVALYPDRHHMVVYGGAVHLSKDFLLMPERRKIFGYVTSLLSGGWGPALPDAQVIALSQEHGIIQLSPEQMAQFRIGDLVAIIPVHSCLAANLHKKYYTLDGEWIPMAQI